jgi:hypothetical protein
MEEVCDREKCALLKGMGKKYKLLFSFYTLPVSKVVVRVRTNWT